MQKIMTQLPEIKLVGITTKANNANRWNSDPSINPIMALVQNYFHNGLSEKIPNRKKPGVTFCVYTHYESDFTGDYTYFIGEEITSFDNNDKNFETLTITSQYYAKFTTQPGPMPDVIINAWEKIWAMKPSDLGGKRAYIADFEVYDERSRDHQNIVLDIYVGIKR